MSHQTWPSPPLNLVSAPLSSRTKPSPPRHRILSAQAGDNAATRIGGGGAKAVFSPLRSDREDKVRVDTEDAAPSIFPKIPKIVHLAMEKEEWESGRRPAQEARLPGTCREEIHGGSNRRTRSRPVCRSPCHQEACSSMSAHISSTFFY